MITRFSKKEYDYSITKFPKRYDGEDFEIKYYNEVKNEIPSCDKIITWDTLVEPGEAMRIVYNIKRE